MPPVAQRPPGSLGLDLRNKTPRACGLCGDIRQLSKAHVPPQAAGNRNQVTSAVSQIVNGQRTSGRPYAGGMWLRGLCGECNSLAGGRYDAAYGDFARRLRSYTKVARRATLPEPFSAPAVSVAPGLVSRSVMFGMFAISPHLRTLSPGLAEDLRSGRTHITMPDGFSLRFALYPLRAARLTGPVYSQRILSRRQHYHTLAEVFFSPLAWVLTPGRKSTSLETTENVLDVQGWGCADEWLHYGDDVTSIDLRNLCRKLPVVNHPTGRRDEWFEMFSDEVTPFLEGYIPFGAE
ncbi:hypothetical protein GA0115237_1119122 [Streptomyces sp. ScaeMP-6W]|nr:hypothetical protein GA0115237_1119122 [Streptomyces sp. ScaeMP-6W]